MAGKAKTETDDSKAKANGAGPGHNSALTEAQEQALFFDCRRRYEKALEKKKAEDAAFKNVCKVIKADLSTTGFTITDIKDAIAMEADGGEAERERIERSRKIARWMALPLGTQLNLLDEDLRPAEEKAEEQGHAAGLAQKADAENPYQVGTPQYQAWLKGHGEGFAKTNQKHLDEILAANELAKKAQGAAAQDEDAGDPFEDEGEVAEPEDDDDRDLRPRHLRNDDATRQQ